MVQKFWILVINRLAASPVIILTIAPNLMRHNECCEQ